MYWTRRQTRPPGVSRSQSVWKSLSVGWENTKSHRSVCVCVRTYTVVALSLCTLRFQTLPQRTAHWSEMNVVTWESKALLGSFPCPFHLHDDDCPHFFFQVFYNRHMPLFFRAPAKNSNRFCPFLLSLFFKTSLLPSKTTLHYSYSHDFFVNGSSQWAPTISV